MKYSKVLCPILMLLWLGVTAAAQQVATSTSSSASQGGATSVLPKGKIAVINTAAVQQQVLEFKNKMDLLNRQFEPRVREVQSLADQITTAENTIKSQSTVLGPAKIAELSEQVDRLKRDYQRKGEDLEAEGQRAREQAFEPIQQKLSKFAQEYTARHGISLLFDLGNALQSNTVVWFDARSDVTQDFINEYNKANPAPTSPAPPPKKP
jgi:outer membrane protein